jgi:hypothetical protein
MKKIIGILLAGALVTSAFAADFNSVVKMSGDIINGTIDITPADGTDGSAFGALKLNKGVVDNNDFLTTSFNGDKAGASFNITLDDRAVKVNSVKLWIQPIDMLKITFGDQNWEAWNETTYSYGRKDAWFGDWYGEGDGTGFDFLLTPIAGFEFNLGFKPGWDGTWLSASVGNCDAKSWNIGVKADLNSYIDFPIAAILNFKNEAKYNGSWKRQYTAGVQYNGSPLYAHVVVRLGEKPVDGTLIDRSMVIDNAFKFSADAFTAWLSVPVLIDLDATPAKNDSGLGYVFKAQYALGAATPYLKLSDTGAKKFSDFAFTPNIELGVDFSVGSCSMNIAAKTTVPSIDKTTGLPAGNLGWSIPFSAKVSF